MQKKAKKSHSPVVSAIIDSRNRFIVYQDKPRHWIVMPATLVCDETEGQKMRSMVLRVADGHVWQIRGSNVHLLRRAATRQANMFNTERKFVGVHA